MNQRKPSSSMWCDDQADLVDVPDDRDRPALAGPGHPRDVEPTVSSLTSAKAPRGFAEDRGRGLLVTGRPAAVTRSRRSGTGMARHLSALQAVTREPRRRYKRRMPTLSLGQVFAGHRIEAFAGRGGMGVVYRATQLALNRVVALKLIAPDLRRRPVPRPLQARVADRRVDRPPKRDPGLRGGRGGRAALHHHAL